MQAYLMMTTLLSLRCEPRDADILLPAYSLKIPVVGRFVPGVSEAKRPGAFPPAFSLVSLHRLGVPQSAMLATAFAA